MKKSKLSVLLVEPGKCPKVIEIESTLEAMQNIVGGDIEVCNQFDDEVVIVCNEEGKVKGLPLNRAVYSTRGELVDIIAGTFFVCYAPVGEGFLSLPKELAEKYEKYFKEPKSFNTEAGGVIVIRDTSGHATYELFDGIGKYYIAKIISKEASTCPHVTRVIAKITGDATKQATIKDIAGNEWPKEQIDVIWPIEDVYAQATLDEVYEILCEMDLGGCLTTDETIRNYVIDMVKAGNTVAPLLESIEKENAEYFYKDFNDWSTTPAVPLYSAIDMIKRLFKKGENMANICSVTMYFYGEKNAVEDLHAKCERWMNMGGEAAKLLSALNINKEDLNLRCEACYVGELFVGPPGDEWFGIDLDCAEDATPAFDIFDRIILRNYVDQNDESKIKYDWIAEEPKCQIFKKHNEGGNCPEKYHLVTPDDYYYPESDEELLGIMVKLFNRQFTGIEEARQFISIYADEHPDEYISLNEFVEC